MRKPISPSCKPRLLSPLLAIVLSACGGGGGDGDGGDVEVAGLDERPANPDCIAPARPVGPDILEFEDVFEDAWNSLGTITKILKEPGGTDRWFVLDREGGVYVFSESDPETVLDWLPDLADDVTAEAINGGLLGMAFHPDYPNTPEVFFFYTAVPFIDGGLVVTRAVLDNTIAPLAPVLQPVLTIDQTREIHQGGDLQFGPDGFLYVAAGDGGRLRNAQRTTNFLGAMLRIDVDGTGAGYEIPDVDPPNPFAGNAKCGPGANGRNCPEIFAWGFRNPYRWGFDAQGRLWLGDVGEVTWEEINLVTRGSNYGWPCREGSDDYIPDACDNDDVLIDPVYAYENPPGLGAAVVGGVVYRGTDIAGLQGKYIFADYVSGEIFALTNNGAGNFTIETLADTPHLISSLAEGHDREVYYSQIGPPAIYKLELDEEGDEIDTIPERLADTGCVDPLDPTQPSDGLIPYDINAPFWSDGAVKERFFAIPDGTTIDVNGQDDWELPSGSILMKNFRVGGRLIETRLFMRHPDGVWAGYTWEWDAGETEATRVIGGAVKDIGGQDWIFPSEDQCMACHNAAPGFSLGAETAQLNRDRLYPAPGGNGLADQLYTLDSIGLMTSPMPPSGALPQLADTSDATVPLEERARAWLHSNCASCHRPGGPTPANFDLSFDTSLRDTGTCEADPASDDLGIPGAKLIKPGDVGTSVIYVRLNSREEDIMMPPLGSNLVDVAGAEVVEDWINSLNSCLD